MSIAMSISIKDFKIVFPIEVLILPLKSYMNNLLQQFFTQIEKICATAIVSFHNTLQYGQCFFYIKHMTHLTINIAF
jgi:hypothetical protein